MEIELRDAPPGDPVTLRLAEALRDEVEERDLHNGAARSDMSLASAIDPDSDRLVACVGAEPVGIGALRLLGRKHGQPAIRPDTIARLVEANGM